MCHGTFDVVHPGHSRHLIYAKSKADILVASLTADAHISKGQHPAATCRRTCARSTSRRSRWSTTWSSTANATPLENLALLQPDYFAKGYEYTAGGLQPKTQEEIEVLEAYGGEMIFTPGDIVYSSSRADRAGAADDRDREAADADGGRGRRPSTRPARRRSTKLEGVPRARRRRHHRRQLHLRRR